MSVYMTWFIKVFEFLQFWNLAYLFILEICDNAINRVRKLSYYVMISVYKIYPAKMKISNLESHWQLSILELALALWDSWSYWHAMDILKNRMRLWRRQCGRSGNIFPAAKTHVSNVMMRENYTGCFMKWILWFLSWTHILRRKEGKEKEFLRNTISDISHQLKTPLVALNIYNGILQGEAENLPTIKEFPIFPSRTWKGLKHWYRYRIC